jgi:hypothetical protein
MAVYGDPERCLGFSDQRKQKGDGLASPIAPVEDKSGAPGNL